MRAWLLVVTALTWGCGASDEGDTEPAELRACAAYAEEVCDATSADCPARVLELVRCLRGDPPGTGTVPPVRTIDRASFADELADEIGDADDLSHEVFWDLRVLERGASFEHIIKLQLIDFVGGYFDWESGQLTLITPEPDQQGGTWETILLAHELVHAEQDRELSLSTWMSTRETTEAELAGRALTEGEAQLYEMLAADYYLDFGVTDADIQTNISTRKAATDELVSASSPFVGAALNFPYSYGLDFVYQTHLAGGAEAVRELYAAPPSTYALLYGVDAAEQQDPSAPPTLAPPDDSWAPWGADRLGAFCTKMVLEQFSDPETATTLTRDYRNDQLDVFESVVDPSDVFGVWRLRLATDTAAETAAAMLDGSPELMASSTATTVTVLITGDARPDLIMQSDWPPSEF